MPSLMARSRRAGACGQSRLDALPAHETAARRWQPKSAPTRLTAPAEHSARHNRRFGQPYPPEMTFPRSKIQPPRPRVGALIERRGLEARLGPALLCHRLVLVCAAAGYGKTASLARQIDRLPPGTAHAWVAADESDDLHRLLGCIVAALEPYDPPWRIAPEALVAQAASGDPRQRHAAAAELLNALDACEVPHGVIVLDDLHRVDDPAVFAFIDLLLEHMGPRWTLVISSRTEPPLALARHRARGELAHFTQADLQFGRDEVRALAAATGLDAGLADRLWQRTAGWPVGLRLALSAAGEPGGALRRSTIDRHVFEFMATEVLEELPAALRGFLLDTSVLPELTAARAAAVACLAEPEAAGMLEEIERRGLFVSVLEVDDDSDDTPTLTLKLHDLFRDALEHRLHRGRPHEVAGLLQRAADTEPDPTRRIGLLLRAGRPAEAAEVLMAAGPGQLAEGAVTSVSRLVAQFPADWAIGSPTLQHMRGLAAWARWDFAEMLDAMRQAESACEARGDLPGRQAAQAYQALALNAFGRMHEAGQRLSVLRREALAPEVRIVVLVACSWHALEVGALQRVGPVLDELMDLLSDDPRMESWYQCMPLPRFNGLPGTARPLQRYADGVLRVAGDMPTPLRASAMVQQGWRLLWQGRLAEAEQAWQHGRADAAWVGDPVNVRHHLQVLGALLHALRGRPAEAAELARGWVQDNPTGSSAWGRTQLLVQAARIAALVNDRPLLADCLQALQAGPASRAEPSALEGARLPLPLQGHLARLEGRRAEAIGFWQQALACEDRIDLVGQAAETRLHLAQALLQAGQPAAAAALLGPVFDRVAAEGEPGGVLLARGPLAVLSAADWDGALAPAHQALLRGWLAQVLPAGGEGVTAPGRAGAQADDGAAPQPRPAGPDQILLPPQARPARPWPSAARPPVGSISDGGHGVAQPAVLPSGPAADRFALSPREREVLERIALGDSNKLIARAFDLSPHTVKRHVANLLDKLGVASRGQAAAWYRQHLGR